MIPDACRQPSINYRQRVRHDGVCIPRKVLGYLALRVSGSSMLGKLQARLQRRMTCEQSMRLPFSRSSVKARELSQSCLRLIVLQALRQAVELLSFAFGAPEAPTPTAFRLRVLPRACVRIALPGLTRSGSC